MNKKKPEISTTITKKHFEMKMEDLNDSGFFLEFKEKKPFWTKRLEKYSESTLESLNIPIVFLVASVSYKFLVVSIWKVCKDFIPPQYRDAIHTEYAYCLKCVALSDLAADMPP